MLISLLQPPPETFALFDDVMLMAEGTVLYHGPVANAVEHMCSFGFELPPRKVRSCSCVLQQLRLFHGRTRDPELMLAWLAATCAHLISGCCALVQAAPLGSTALTHQGRAGPAKHTLLL